MSDDQPVVTYPLNEVLGRIERTVDGIDKKLDQQYGDLDRRVRDLEVERAERAKAREVGAEYRHQSVESRRASTAMWVAGLAALGAVAEAIVQAVGH